MVSNQLPRSAEGCSNSNIARFSHADGPVIMHAIGRPSNAFIAPASASWLSRSLAHPRLQLPHEPGALLILYLLFFFRPTSMAFTS